MGDELIELQERLFGFALEDVIAFVREHILNVSVAWQFAAGFGLAVLAVLIGPRLARLVARLAQPIAQVRTLAVIGRTLRPLAAPALLYLFYGVTTEAAARFGQPKGILESFETLAAAWVVIRLASQIVRSKLWSRVVFYVAWTGAALDILGLLEPTIAWLETAGVSVGDTRISLLTVVRALLAAAFLLWAARFGAGAFERGLERADRFTPSMRVLFVQLMKLALPVFALILALGFAGIDLTIFAVFSGALAVGLGLGLQRSIGNLVAGLMVISDKSIKPGDVIAIDDIWGWVTSLGPRYVSLRTRDGIEHLIPNENFIMNGVENWSHTDTVLRRKLPFGVAYGSDAALVQRLGIEAAKGVERVLETPTPVCLMKGFGDSALDFELRFWIGDPQNGLSNVESMVYIRLYDALNENGIVIPFPQRDLHIKEAPGGLAAGKGVAPPPAP